MNSNLIISAAEVETAAMSRVSRVIRQYREALGWKYLTHPSFYALAQSYGNQTRRMLDSGASADIRFNARLAFHCAQTALDTHANSLAR